MATEHNTLFQLAADYVQFTHENIFLTGKAGTGKTTFLRYIREHSGKQSAIVAPTGVAAINAGGTTIHSFFQLPFSPFVPGPIRQAFDLRQVQSGNERIVDRHQLLGRIKLNREKRDLLRTLELLVIDEISMVRCDTLDAIDAILRHVRGRQYDAFGGVQVLLIGDMHQLPPVIPNEEWSMLSQFYSSPYFFSSRVTEEQPPVYIELEKIYRQSDATFIDVLNKVRNHRMDADAMQVLQSRYQPNFKPKGDEGYITLTTHNNKAFTINQEGLQQLHGKLLTYKAVIEKDFSDKAYPAEENLQLKVGAQVMFIKNDKEKVRRYFNGKIGIITKVEEDAIYVECKNETEPIKVVLEKWENIRYSLNATNQQIEEEVIGSFTQYPLRLAWAITIHKSQGLTFEKAVIDAGSAFAPGQVYVALSRCTSLEGLVLQSLITNNSLYTDEKIISFSNNKSNTAALESNLLASKQLFREKTMLQLFQFDKAVNSMGEVIKLLKEHSNSFHAEGLPWIQTVDGQLQSLQQVALKFHTQLVQLFKQPYNDEAVNERIIKATNYFVQHLEQLIHLLPQSPVISDSRNYAQEYYAELKNVYAELYAKHQLIGTCNEGFNMAAYQQKKVALQIPSLSVNAYAGAVYKKTNSPHPILHRQLRELRDALCAADNTPLYFVAGTSTLEELAKYLPQTIKDLKLISGFGEAKIEKYGQQFIDVIVSYCNEHGLESQIFEKKAKKEKITKSGTVPKEGSTAQITFNLHQQGLTAAEIAAQRNLAVSTIEGHLSQFVLTGEVDVFKLMDATKLDAIYEAIETTKIDTATPLLAHLGNNYSYAELRYGINYYRSKHPLAATINNTSEKTT